LDETAKIREDLWSSAIDSSNYVSAEFYYSTLFEQYKIYVEMADRISGRRGLANTFFLTVNTAIFSTAVAFSKDAGEIPGHALLLLLVAALGQCGAWWWIVRSYRLLNSAKYKVIGVLEERLPASPYWRAEWQALGEGKDWRLYLPLTHMEQFVPLLFAAMYVAAYFAVR
jgi:hypothetical protein